MIVSVPLKFLLNISTATVGVGDREVDLEEAPCRVALDCHCASHDDDLNASWYPVRELVRLQHSLRDVFPVYARTEKRYKSAPMVMGRSLGSASMSLSL